MICLYSIPLAVTGPSIVYHSIREIDIYAISRISQLTPEDFNKTPITSSNSYFNDYFTTLESFQKLRKALIAKENVSWISAGFLNTICFVDNDTKNYLIKKRCLYNKITFHTLKNQAVFTFNYYPKNSTQSVSLGNKSSLDLNASNVKNLIIPECSIQHCIREYLLNLKCSQIGSVKEFVEDGDRFQIQTKYIQERHYF